MLVRALFLVLSVSVGCVSPRSASASSRPQNVAVNPLAVDSGPRIVNGYAAQPGEFPYQVSVRSRRRSAGYGHFCGGAILTESVVVTAAHCVHEVEGSEIGSLYIVAGSVLLSKGGAQRDVREKRVHPDYGPVYQDYDIALLYLDKPLTLDGSSMAAVELQTLSLPPGISCKASGWGHTSENGKSLPDNLQGVEVPTIDQERCAAYYEAETDYSPVIETQLCAGFEEGEKDACQGDSGGPLVCNGLLTGIVSWGSGCARPGFPGVYSDVFFLTPWIEENVAFNSSTPSPTSGAVTANAAPGLILAVGLAFLAMTTTTSTEST